MTGTKIQPYTVCVHQKHYTLMITKGQQWRNCVGINCRLIIVKIHIDPVYSIVDTDEMKLLLYFSIYFIDI